MGQNEKLIYEAHFHGAYYSAAWFALIFLIVLAVGALVFATGTQQWVLLGISAAGLAFVLYQMIPIWTTEIAVTNHRLVVKRGWLTRSTSELQLKSIEQAAVATALPKTSCAQVTTAAGVTATSLEIRRRSRLSRGRSIKRCGPRLTGWR